ncbi:MAG: hypothetical protein D6704_10935 [Nitrospirae bacterium]|nr:MAG: hypothetical protein D6704_10935 [Nitrospirota bacterium]
MESQILRGLSSAADCEASFSVQCPVNPSPGKKLGFQVTDSVRASQKLTSPRWYAEGHTRRRRQVSKTERVASNGFPFGRDDTIPKPLPIPLLPCQGLFKHCLRDEVLISARKFFLRSTIPELSGKGSSIPSLFVVLS